MSLRTKMILAFVLLVFAVAGSLILFIGVDNARQVKNYILRGGMFGMQDVVENLERYYDQNGSWAGVEDIIATQQMMGQMNGMGPRHNEPFTLTDTNLVVVWSATNDQIGQKISGQSENTGIQLSDPSGMTIGYLFVSGKNAIQASEISPLFTSLRKTLVRVSVIAILLAILFAILFTNRLVKPINRLTAAAKTLSQGDLSVRVSESGKDEIAILGKSFNEMADSLQKSEERKKAMTADIAHELRSPLAVQRAQLEAMQDGIVPMTTESLQTVVDQTNFLARLVDDLRTLALVDAGELPMEKHEVSIVELVNQVVERFQSQAAQHQIKLIVGKISCGSNEKILADSDRIVQIYGNLISNALHHTPENGTITLDLAEEKDFIISHVSDTGCGINQADLPHLFERFYRGDKARGHEFSSTGLGLSIARNLARVHGGDLTASNGENGGAVFTLRLPKLS